MKSAAKKSPAKKVSTAKSGAGAGIRIRMYRVGFGDCFLVTFPTADGPRHMLVDCGVHGKGDIKVRQGTGQVSLIQQAVEDIAKETDKKLAVVIATHQHQDHISGFVKEWFEGFEVKEVWMPWFDDPRDAKARVIKARQAALVNHLQLHLAAVGGSAVASAALENLAANASAMQLLHGAFGTGEAKYFEAGATMKNPAGIDGLSVKVLAPSRDESFLAKMDPPAGQRFLRLDGGVPKDSGAVTPFVGKWIDGGTRSKELTCPATMVQALKDASEESLDGLALALDKVRNNTSIVVSIMFRGQHLLFPGDAQYGNWSSWMDGADGGDVLSSVGFYKTAHHGSYNATPKAALDRMTSADLVAMVSTQDKPWASIPLPALIKALDQQTSKKVARSDSIAVSNAAAPPPMAPAGTLAKCFQKGEFWIDYLMPC